METLLKTLLDIRGLKLQRDDDFADRLSRRYTCSMLFLFSLLVTARTYWGHAIHCWCPENCAGNHERYANLYCWISHTYFVPFNAYAPQTEDDRSSKITYYQWTPIILLCQSALFFLPCAVWRILNRRSGVHLGVITEAAIASQRSHYADGRQKALRYAVHLMDRYLLAQRREIGGDFSRAMRMVARNCPCFCGRLHGNYLMCAYMCVKLLYAANAIGQLFALDVILGYEYHMFGIHVIRHFIYNEQWIVTQHFPHVTLCDFKIRQFTNVQRHTVQCVLPINIFNEKIFVIIWFWFVFVSVVTIADLLYWLSKCLYWPAQFRFVKRQLRAMDALQNDKFAVRTFCEQYLRRDGMFVLRLIGKNAGDLTAAELMCGMWEHYICRKRHDDPKAATVKDKRITGDVV